MGWVSYPSSLTPSPEHASHGMRHRRQGTLQQLLDDHVEALAGDPLLSILALAWALLWSKAFGLHLALLQALASGCIVDFALASLSAASITNFAMALLKVLPINTEAVDLLQAPCTIGIVE